MSFTIDYKDKVVLVTGVSSGIGLGTAREFARAGAHVAGCARKAAEDQSAVAFREAVESQGVRALYVQTDVTCPEQLEQLVEETIRTFGRLDILVSSAGMNVFEGAGGCTEERWQYNLDLNLASHWRLSKLCKPYLEQSGEGVILLMTSNHAFGTIPGCFPYSVTKQRSPAWFVTWRSNGDRLSVRLVSLRASSIRQATILGSTLSRMPGRNGNVRSICIRSNGSGQ